MAAYSSQYANAYGTVKQCIHLFITKIGINRREIKYLRITQWKYIAYSSMQFLHNRSQ